MAHAEKVLVTGATGFVGANLTRRLLIEGYNVAILTRRTSNKWRLNDVLRDVDKYEVDLLESKKLKSTIEEIKPSVIFHLANEGVYGGVAAADQKMVETNLLGFLNLIESCDGIDYRCLINTGSSSEYGIKQTPMKEDDACEPVTAYGVSKYAASLYASFTAKTKNKPIITLRLFSPFGPYDDSRRLVSYAIINAIKGNELKLASRDAVRDYVFIDDVLELYLKTINKAEKFRGEIFNVGTGVETKISYIIDTIIKIIKSQSIVKWGENASRSFDAKKWKADITKTSHSFNWKPSCSIKEGLEKTIEWFKNNMSLYE